MSLALYWRVGLTKTWKLAGRYRARRVRIQNDSPGKDCEPTVFFVLLS